MRMRRKPWARPELDASEVYIKNPHDYYEKWQSAFDKEQPLCMELGCGKGGFISQKAFMHPEKNWIAFDIERIPLVVSPKDTIEEIYINFCNPWPKDRHKKRRLTHTRQLENYKTFLKDGGKIFFKTDDDELFTESLDYFARAGFTVDFITYDMAENPLPENIVTEHEKMFTEQGIKIKGLIATKG